MLNYNVALSGLSVIPVSWMIHMLIVFRTSTNTTMGFIFAFRVIQVAVIF